VPFRPFRLPSLLDISHTALQTTDWSPLGATPYYPGFLALRRVPSGVVLPCGIGHFLTGVLPTTQRSHKTI
jgi:hypothetical protein